MMTPEEVKVVRDACAGGVRTLHDMSDALAAISVAAKLMLDAVDKIEQGLLDINGLAD
jgi:hypothetical protein